MNIVELPELYGQINTVSALLLDDESGLIKMDPTCSSWGKPKCTLNTLSQTLKVIDIFFHI